MKNVKVLALETTTSGDSKSTTNGNKRPVTAFMKKVEQIC